MHKDDHYSLIYSLLLVIFTSFFFYFSETQPIRGYEKEEKYPRVEFNYMAQSKTNMYMLGAVSHQVDFRKSSGGFIHGFRYTGKNGVKTCLFK